MYKKQIINFINKILKPIDTLLQKLIINNDKLMPIFIIGAPRTGSTLLYQFMVASWDVAYLSNLHCKLYRLPVLASILCKTVFHFKKYSPDFKSLYGQTEGQLGPSECGQFWYQWLPFDKHYIQAGEISQHHRDSIKNAVGAVRTIYRKPLIFKNMNCGQRLGLLYEIFPSALFLFCRRSPIFIAQSILLARDKINKDRKRWWSIMPKEYSEINLEPPHSQIVKQIYFIEKQIKDDLEKYYSERYLEIWYEDLTKDPIKVLKTIQNFVEMKDLHIHVNQYPKNQFKNENVQKINDQDFAILKAKIDEYYDKI